MPYRVVEFEPTPNPDALKCALDGVVREGSAAYRSAEAAAGDPVASRLMAIEGVAHVLLCNDWVTVAREKGAPWGPIKKAVRAALKDAP